MLVIEVVANSDFIYAVVGLTSWKKAGGVTNARGIRGLTWARINDYPPRLSLRMRS